MFKLELAACAVALCAVTAQGQTPSPLISGNNASFGGGPIATTDYPSGPTVSFVPTGTTDANCGGTLCNGRGLVVLGNKIFYTELSNGFGATDFIHAAPFNLGAGGPDNPAWALTNPRPGFGVQDLDYNDGFIYALTGYPAQAPPQVFKISAAGGGWIGPVTLGPPASTNSDGFTVLPNGNFLVNNGVASCTYDQFSPTTGPIIPGTSVVLAGGRSPLDCIGVDNDETLSPYALYVSHYFSGTLSKNDSAGGLAGPAQTPGDGWTIVEDISLEKGFAGLPGAADCHGKSVSNNAKLFGGTHNAASVLGYGSVQDYEEAVRHFCGE